MASAKQPIGIFDSGIGGLTVASAIRHLLPHEDMVYFGDTAHLPYGDKSTAAIQAYSVKITDLLLKRGCKVIVIACNSASAAAHDLIREYVGKKARVFNVIDPVVHYLREHYENARVGLIGTRQTVGSRVYEQKAQALDKGIEIQSLATPLLVPMIEEGYVRGDISRQIIAQYLSNPVLNNIRALILGCTHYPLIRAEIQSYYEDRVEILDSAEIVARALKAYLEYNLLVHQHQRTPDFECMISDYTTSFEELTTLFFGTRTSLDHFDLWH